MATEAISQEFNAYKVYYITSNIKPYHAVVSCFQGEEEVGLLRFVADDQPLQRIKVVDGVITMDYHLRRFGDIYQMLLNESPLLIYVSPDAHWGSVTTSTLEPIGKQDPSSFVQDIVTTMNKDGGKIDPNIAG